MCVSNLSFLFIQYRNNIKDLCLHKNVFILVMQLYHWRQACWQPSNSEIELVAKKSVQMQVVRVQQGEGVRYRKRGEGR